METSKKVLKCDVCGKTAEAEDVGYYGGHPFQGWFILNERGGSTMLEELQRKKNWDICSIGCLKKFTTAPSFRKKQNKLPIPKSVEPMAFDDLVKHLDQRAKKLKKKST